MGEPSCDLRRRTHVAFVLLRRACVRRRREGCGRERCSIGKPLAEEGVDAASDEAAVVHALRGHRLDAHTR